MKTATTWRAGWASDPGLVRAVNEDRIYVDEERGIFIVADGLGGHAAGEHAAEIAVGEIAARLNPRDRTDIEQEVRLALTAANNRIYEAAQANEAWRGMACVATLAVISEDRVTIGHVGDSRLYLFRNGGLRKLTSDHSPVGEQEEHGELTEQQAMRHPRRNEIFRDIGSVLHESADEHFIDTQTLAFPSDGAILLCSDGLSDTLTSAAIAVILGGFDGDVQRTAQQLIEAANHAGGKDNISVILIAGPDFAGHESTAAAETRARHGITRMRTTRRALPQWLRNLLWLIGGAALGVGIPVGLEWYAHFRTTPAVSPPEPRTVPQHIAVNSTDSLGIIKALSTAISGDTIDVPSGEYLGPVILKEGVRLVSDGSGRAVVRSDPKSPNYPGIAIVSSGIQDGRVRGLAVTGDDEHPLRVGLLIQDSSIEADELDVSGAIEGGILIEGDSRPLLLANFLHGNAGPGAVIRDRSSPRLAGNTITGNGLLPDAVRPGLDVSATAQPSLLNNMIYENGTDLKGRHLPKGKTGFKPDDATQPQRVN